jgi:hypothetical protein
MDKGFWIDGLSQIDLWIGGCFQNNGSFQTDSYFEIDSSIDG